MVQCYPLTIDRWSDFEQLFGPKGADGGCWCMWWRLKRQEFEAQRGDGNRQAMHAIVQHGRVPGLLAYQGDLAVGWISVAEREEFGPLNRSRVLKRLDDLPVWSIVCFYIDETYRAQGVAEALIQAAINYVREQGGRIVEAYPTVPGEDGLSSGSAFMGVPAMFERAGFVHGAQRSSRKAIMRYYMR